MIVKEETQPPQPGLIAQWCRVKIFKFDCESDRRLRLNWQCNRLHFIFGQFNRLRLPDYPMSGMKSAHKAHNLIPNKPPQPKEHWIESVTNIDLTHSARQACKVINWLTGRSPTKKWCSITPDSLTKAVVNNSITKNLDKVSMLKTMKELKHQSLLALG